MVRINGEVDLYRKPYVFDARQWREMINFKGELLGAGRPMRFGFVLVPRSNETARFVVTTYDWGIKKWSELMFYEKEKYLKLGSRYLWYGIMGRTTIPWLFNIGVSKYLQSFLQNMNLVRQTNLFFFWFQDSIHFIRAFFLQSSK